MLKEYLKSFESGSHNPEANLKYIES